MPPVSRKPAVEPFRDRSVTVEEPLEFLRVSTYRQRQVGVTLEQFDLGEAHADQIIAACHFLSVDMPLHFFDVADDLAPLLRERCKPADNIEPILKELDEAQRTVRTLAEKTARGLMAQLKHMPEKKPSKSLRKQALVLLAALRRLSAIENGIVLPLARVRLHADDLKALTKGLGARRGLS